MRTKKLGLGFLVAVVIGAAAASAAASVVGGSPESSPPEAYVTLLYGDEFLLGPRVLGKSIRDTGSNKDMVVLASDGVSDFAKKLLQWMVDEKDLRVIHYTLASLTPWDWWTAWLVKPVDVWQNIRDQLEETLAGTGGGRNPNEQLLIKILFVLPLRALIFCYYQSKLQVPLSLHGESPRVGGTV